VGHKCAVRFWFAKNPPFANLLKHLHHECASQQLAVLQQQTEVAWMVGQPSVPSMPTVAFSSSTFLPMSTNQKGPSVATFVTSELVSTELRRNVIALRRCGLNLFFPWPRHRLDAGNQKKVTTASGRPGQARPRCLGYPSSEMNPHPRYSCNISQGL
jgi:hypothetical protein